MKRLYISALAFAILGLASCHKNEITQFSTPSSGAKLKLIHAVPGLPAVDGYVNNTKITPVISTTVTDNTRSTTILTGTSFSSVANTNQYTGVFPVNNDYAVVTPGNATIKLVTSTPAPALVSAQTAAPGTTVVSVTQNLETGKNYSVFAGGFSDAPVGVVVEDKFTQPAASDKVYVRFANFIPNGGNLDLGVTYTLTGAAASSATPVTNVASQSVSDWVALPANTISTTSYTFQGYKTGTTTKLGSASSALVFTPGRYYTIIAKGLAADYVVPNTTITLKASARSGTDPVQVKIPEIYYNPPNLSFYVNK